MSGDVSNCSYRLTVHPVTSLHVSSAKIFVYAEKKPPKLSRIPSRPLVVYLNEAPTGHCLTSVEKGVLTPTWLGALTHRTATVVGVCVSASACMHMCVLVCVICLHIYDNNIDPG